jgi:hypothetical protein
MSLARSDAQRAGLKPPYINASERRDQALEPPKNRSSLELRMSLAHSKAQRAGLKPPNINSSERRDEP